jgi:predicted secreted protein
MWFLNKKMTLAAVACSLSFPMVSLHAADPERSIQLQAEASRVVENDEMQAALYTELTEKDAVTLANKLNLITNQALQTAKVYRQVKVRSGNQSSYPIYDDKHQAKGWRGQTQIILTSQDFQQMSQLIAKLQSHLRLQNVSFEVSDAQRYKIETELHVEASNAFRERAQALLSSWNASQYKLLNVRFTSGGAIPQRRMSPMSMSFASKSADVATPEFAEGESTISVTAEGSVQLQ